MDGRDAWRRMLGQIGLPGGGFGYGYGSLGDVGRAPLRRARRPTCRRARTRCEPFIPVARIADMLLQPGRAVRLRRPAAHLPRHPARLLVRRQPLPPPPGPGPAAPRARAGRTRSSSTTRSGRRWRATPTSSCPATMTLERERHRRLAERRLPGRDAPGRRARTAQARERLRDLRRPRRARSASASAFTEGRDEMAWLRHLYEGWRERVAAPRRARPPDFDEFWATGFLELPDADDDLSSSRRSGPTRRARRSRRRAAGSRSSRRPSTASATTTAPATRPGSSRTSGSARRSRAALPAPARRQQPDARACTASSTSARISQASKVQGREPIRMHPADAARAGHPPTATSCASSTTAGAASPAPSSRDAVRPRVVQLSTGAWYDPLDPADPDAMCVHGNPNVLTFDRGTSQLAQGCTGQHALVEIERWTAPAADPRVRSAADRAAAGPVAGAAAAGGAPRRLRPGGA